MNKYSTVLGLGQDNYADQPWLGTSDAATATTTTTEKKPLTEKISDWLNLAKEGANVFQTVKQDGSSSPTYVLPNTPPPAPNNTMKYALIAGGAALAIGAVVLLTRGSKKKSLGDVGAVGATKAKPKRRKRKK